MTIKYVVRAQIVDITRDTPKLKDAFLVDTHVWYWMIYARAKRSSTPPQQYQISAYPSYTNTAFNIGAQLFQSCLSLVELAHLIEKAEKEIYETFNGQIGAKQYRHNIPDERSRVYNEIQTVCSMVKELSKPLAIPIDDPLTSVALSRLETERVDGYDVLILESMKRHGIVQIITDDGDFSSVPGIQVFTANRNLIKAAKTQGKLVKRA